MSFIKPEDDLETYNKLSEYYDIADNLTKEIQTSTELSIQQKQDILFPIIDKIKELADILIESYIQHLKDNQNVEKLLLVRDNIENVLNKIDLFKNKIYNLYMINNNNS